VAKPVLRQKYKRKSCATFGLETMQQATSEFMRGIIGRFELEPADHDDDGDMRLDRYKPLFLARGLSANERVRLTAMLATARAAGPAEQVAALVAVLSDVLVGWRHVYRGAKGDPEPFDPAVLPDLLTVADLWAIADGCTEASATAEAAAVLSDPPQVAGASR
jgi:hypothetical protein